MPIYEYECTKCGHQAEVLQKFSDPPLAECDVCHGDMKKFISQNTFHLKGTGWYVTDYASKSGGNQGKQSKSESMPSSTESKGSTEASNKKEPSGEKKPSKVEG